MRMIEVAKVELAKARLPAKARGTALAELLDGKRLEQAYTSPGKLVLTSRWNAFADMVNCAFYQHRPIALSPDAIWFCIAQGFAIHVNANAETLRHRFVKHAGKATLVVERSDFHLGSSNPWPKAFSDFSDQIAAHVGKARDLVVADFSTTGPLERAASEVVLMHAFEPYFDYTMMVGCGIPRVALLGEPADWRSIRVRAQALSEYGLEHWTRALLPVLDKLVAAAEGETDAPFWQSFYHYKMSSGGDSNLTGWIHVLFPYLTGGRRSFQDPVCYVPNSYLSQWEKNYWKIRVTASVRARCRCPRASRALRSR